MKMGMDGRIPYHDILVSGPKKGWEILETCDSLVCVHATDETQEDTQYVR